MQARTFFVLAIVLCIGGALATPRGASSDAAKRAALVLVYARDPLQTPEPVLAELPLPVKDRALSHAWITAHSCVDAGELSRDKGMHVCSVIASAGPNSEGRFVARPLAGDAAASAPDPFAEQMLFYHGAKSLLFFARLGLVPLASAAPLQLIANVRLPAPAGATLRPFRDATFIDASARAGVLEAMAVPPGPIIYFGQDQAVRVAYDAAAIRHEVAHAVLAPWLPKRAWFVDEQGDSPAPGAISEGLADYFAAAIAGDPRIGAHANQQQQRNLSATLRCPESMIGEAHEDGLVLASTLWAARQQLGAALDAAIVRSLRERPATIEQLLDGVLKALAVKQQIARSIFHERGLTPSCQRVLELEPQQSLSGANGRFQLPAAEEGLPLASSALQLRVAVPDGELELELRMRTGNARASRFDPALLVKAAPIRWTPAASHDATLVPAAEGSRDGELRFVVPTSGGGARYLQLVNRGKQMGWFDTIRVALRRRP